MDLLRRVRWGNVARAAALLAAVALVLAWPSLRSDPPPLPPEPAIAAPAPVRQESAEFAVERPVAPRTRQAKPGGKPRRRATPRAGRRTSRARRRARRRVKPRAGAEPVAPPVRPGPTPAPTWTPPPQSEFGLGE